MAAEQKGGGGENFDNMQHLAATLSLDPSLQEGHLRRQRRNQMKKELQGKQSRDDDQELTLCFTFADALISHFWLTSAPNVYDIQRNGFQSSS